MIWLELKLELVILDIDEEELLVELELVVVAAELDKDEFVLLDVAMLVGMLTDADVLVL